MTTITNLQPIVDEILTSRKYTSARIYTLVESEKSSDKVELTNQIQTWLQGETNTVHQRTYTDKPDYSRIGDHDFIQFGIDIENYCFRLVNVMYRGYEINDTNIIINFDIDSVSCSASITHEQGYIINRSSYINAGMYSSVGPSSWVTYPAIETHLETYLNILHNLAMDRLELDISKSQITPDRILYNMIDEYINAFIPGKAFPLIESIKVLGINSKLTKVDGVNQYEKVLVHIVIKKCGQFVPFDDYSKNSFYLTLSNDFIQYLIASKGR